MEDETKKSSLTWIREVATESTGQHAYISCRLLVKKDTADYLEAEFLHDPAVLASVLLDDAVKERRKHRRRKPKK